MKALTLPRPLPSAILTLGMDTVRYTPDDCPLKWQEWFAIYASAQWDGPGASWIADRFGSDFCDRPDRHPVGIVAIAQFGALSKGVGSLWWGGPRGLVFRNVIPVEPAIALPESSGLWELPESALFTLRRAWKLHQDKCQGVGEEAPTPTIPTGAICLYSGIGGMSGRLVKVLGVYAPTPEYLHCEVLEGRDRAPTGETFGCHPDWLREIAPATNVHQPAIW